ncbi:MAG: aspartate--tRNA(Asn) ligase [Acidimicrobiaceae bacterium]|nr:aspartate--tRNA(Asn) ligase [Acidimicrobiaceae bacterium]
MPHASPAQSKPTAIADLKTHPRGRVTVCGFVETIRDHSAVVFVIIRDKTAAVQVVADSTDETPYTEDLKQLTIGTAVTVTGKLVDNKIVKLGGLEIQLEELAIASIATSPLPIDEDTGLDKRLDWRFVDLRQPQNTLIFKIQTLLEHAFRLLWIEEGFIEIHSPKIMASASESGGELFRLDYFDGHAYLAQSPQFYKQMAMAAGFERVFEIAPVFRANPSFTSRHDTEFTSVDVEISWVDGHHDVMDLEERMLVAALTAVKEQFGDVIHDTFGVDVVVPERPFPRIKHADAVQIVADRGYSIPRADGDLDPEAERRLAEHVKETHGHEFVFVTDYPPAVRAFYHMRYEDGSGLTKGFDLIWKGLEITTGAQREHRYDMLLSQAEEKGIGYDEIAYYLNFFKYGCPPHGGFGLGLTRILMILLGIRNVREVTYLYRGPNRIHP